jgi:hypothetical protein
MRDGRGSRRRRGGGFITGHCKRPARSRQSIKRTSSLLINARNPAKECHSEQREESAVTSNQRVTKSRFLVACARRNDTPFFPQTASGVSSAFFPPAATTSRQRCPD